MRPLRALAFFAVFVLPWACKKEEAPPERAAEPVSTAAPAPAPTPSAATASDQAAKTPSAAPERNLLERKELSTVDDAEKALAQAKTELDGLLAGTRSGPGGGATPLASGDPRCPNACKAMDSLRRAADAVCRLAGASDQRCSHAKGVVDESQKRVAACKCEQG